MANIKVDHSKFAATATAVDNYVRLLKTRMTQANAEVSHMGRAWEGTDYAQFASQWSKVTNGESTYAEMVKSLESYAKFLRMAESKYKQAQINAVNRANSLPKW